MFPRLRGKKPGPDEKVAVEVAKDASTLFSCPKKGCVKVYERYSSLEKHMSFGKYEIISGTSVLTAHLRQLPYPYL